VTTTVALLIYFISAIGVMLCTFMHFRYNLRFGMKVRDIFIQGLFAIFLIVTPWVNTAISCAVLGFVLVDALYRLFQSDFFTREIKIGDTK